MNINKTTENESNVPEYIKGIEDFKKREDCNLLIKIFKTETGYEPKMCGSGIVGFGTYHYKYESGREGDVPIVAFAFRRNAISLYLSPNFVQKEDLLYKFGKYKTGKGCIYIQKLEDVDLNILTLMVQNSVESTKW